MTDPCDAVPPPSIYGRGVHVEPCILAPNHGGPHLPGNQDELDKRPRPSILRAHERDPRMKPLWLRRLICYLAGHEYDEANYVPGSWKLDCTRCDHSWRM